MSNIITRTFKKHQPKPDRTQRMEKLMDPFKKLQTFFDARSDLKKLNLSPEQKQLPKIKLKTEPVPDTIYDNDQDLYYKQIDDLLERYDSQAVDHPKPHKVNTEEIFQRFSSLPETKDLKLFEKQYKQRSNKLISQLTRNSILLIQPPAAANYTQRNSILLSSPESKSRMQISFARMIQKINQTQQSQQPKSLTIISDISTPRNRILQKNKTSYHEQFSKLINNIETVQKEFIEDTKNVTSRIFQIKEVNKQQLTKYDGLEFNYLRVKRRK
ncbi:hypothetical protein pb186bvf_008041 [Paramecium bursaria]